MNMYGLIAVVVVAGPWVESPHFPRAKQEAALNATLRLTNPKTSGEGTAVRIGQDDVYVYYLTAQHNVVKTKSVDLESFSAATFPKVVDKIKNAEVFREWPEIDVALIRAKEANPTGFLSITKKPSGLSVKFPVLTVGCSDPRAPTLMVDEVLCAREGKKADQLKSQWYWEAKNGPEIGRSGGPIVSVSGYLIGICSGVDLGTKKGYYIHEGAIRKALKEEGREQLLVAPAQPDKPEK